MLYALIICPHIISHPASNIGYIITRALQVVSVLIWIALLTIKHKTTQNSNKSFSHIVNIWWLIIVTISLSKVPILQFTQFYYWITVWDILLIAEIYWTKDFKRHLHNMVVLFSFLVYLCVFLYILFPDGLWIEDDWIGTGNYERYLFGNYNQTGLVALIAIMLNGVYSLYTGQGYTNMLFLSLASIITIMAMGSMTSTVGLIIICAYFIFHKLIRRPYLLIAIFTFLYVAFFSLIVWQGQDIENWQYISQFIENVLGKSTTFSSRIYLWLNSTLLIKDSLFFGYGAQGVEWMVNNIGGSGPHNLWLMILLEGGLVLCVSLIFVIAYTFISLRKNNTNAGAFAAICLCDILLMSLFETYYIVCVFFILIIAYYTYLTKDTLTAEES